MKCANCGIETEAGDLYQFFYGNPSGEARYTKNGVNMVEKKFSVGGSQQMFICNKCLAEDIANSGKNLGGLVTLSAVLILSGFLFLATDSSKLFGFILLLAGIVSGFGAFLIFRTRQTITKYLTTNDTAALEKHAKSNRTLGEWMAIGLGRDALEKQGYTNFWTTNDYESLRKN